MRENFQFGGGVAESMLHPVAAVVLVIAILVMLTMSRRRMLVAFMCTAFLIPLAQELYVAGLHMFVLRIVIMFAWFRIAGMKILSKDNIIPDKFNSLDTAFLLWGIFRASAVILLFMVSGAVINQFAFLWDAFGAYFLLRYLIRDEEDIHLAIKTFAVIATIISLTMLNEKLRGENLFGLLGGVPYITTMREDSLRAQGPFSHAILAGVFGATLLPLFIWLWKIGKDKFLATLGIIASTIITITSASSTPLMAYGAVVLGVCFWPLRKNMRQIRWGIVLGLLGIQLFMKVPVWWLIGRVDLIAGNSGYHRAMLIDQFMRHFTDWWLRGTAGAVNWGWDMWDLSNQFVAEGETGGLATFVCFIAMISISFGMIGKARKAVNGDTRKEWSLWLFGVAMLANVTAFFGISYYDHMQAAWFAFLVMISVLTTSSVAEPVRDLEVNPTPVLRLSFTPEPQPGLAKSLSVARKGAPPSLRSVQLKSKESIFAGKSVRGGLLEPGK